jgi:hypothetical protein
MQGSMNDRYTNSELGGVRVAGISVEASNARVVSLQLLDRENRDLAIRSGVWGYLATDANGDVMEPHSATLTIAASTDGIVVPNAAANVAGHSMFFAVSEADGDLDISITQTSGADTFYLVIVLPNGELFVTSAITFA